jgi:hypothetical protein
MALCEVCGSQYAGWRVAIRGTPAELIWSHQSLRRLTANR